MANYYVQILRINHDPRGHQILSRIVQGRDEDEIKKKVSSYYGSSRASVGVLMCQVATDQQLNSSKIKHLNFEQ